MANGSSSSITATEMESHPLKAVAVLVVSVVVCVALISAVSGDAQAAHGCSASAPGVYGKAKLRHKRTGCQSARAVFHGYHKKRGRNGRFDQRVHGFSCHGSYYGDETLRVRCVSGNKRVSWYAYLAGR